MRRKDGLCSSCGTPHQRQSALCTECAAVKEKARKNGHAPTRESQAVTREVKKALFLQALQQNGGHVALACKTAKTTRPTVGDWRDDDPEFAAMWEAIQDVNVELLETEVDKRALGYTQQTLDGDGNIIRSVSQVSDNLLMFRLKALRPEKYRDGPRAGQGSELSNEELDAALQRMIARRSKALKSDITESTAIN